MNAVDFTQLSELLKLECFYYLIPYGVGDCFVITNFKRALEDKLGGEVKFVIKENHYPIMKLNGLAEDDCILLKCSVVHDYRSFERDLRAFQFVKAPERGKVYVAHPLFALEPSEVSPLVNGRPFVAWNRKFLGLSESTSLHLDDLHFPKVSENLRKKVKESIGEDVESLVVFLPEANSIPTLNNSFWEDLAKRLHGEGKKIITNQNKCGLKGIPGIQMDLEELIALCMSCREVYSLRSGICDVVFKKGRGLHIFYPRKDLNRNLFNMSVNYQQSDVDEQSI